MKPLVFIDGSQGTTGLQMRTRLRDRDDISLLELPEERRKDARWRAEAINDCDFAILCLPDGPARDAADSVTNPSVRIIDASSAHRLNPSWAYGFAEMDEGQGARIAAANRVANPGCYPTGAIGLLRPLVLSGVLPPDYPATVHAISGYSGRGRPGIEEREHQPGGERAMIHVYGLNLNHKHVPEIERYAGLTRRPCFVPAYGSFRQGIVLTIPLHLRLLTGGTHAAKVHDCLAAHYAGTDRVEVAVLCAPGEARHLDPEDLNDTDRLRLNVFADEAGEQILLAAVFDNLGKGAAGAAEQNLDLMLYGTR